MHSCWPPMPPQVQEVGIGSRHSGAVRCLANLDDAIGCDPVSSPVPGGGPVGSAIPAKCERRTGDGGRGDGAPCRHTASNKGRCPKGASRALARKNQLRLIADKTWFSNKFSRKAS